MRTLINWLLGGSIVFDPYSDPGEFDPMGDHS